MKYYMYFILTYTVILSASSSIHDDEYFFKAEERDPFSRQSKEDCGEPVYCGHTTEFQQRIVSWQNPHNCSSFKFLIFEPPSDENGLGSMIQIIGSVFRQAICLGRILYLNPNVIESLTLSRWMYPGCDNSTSSFECYFERLTSCSLSFQEIQSAKVSQGGFGLNAYPLRGERIVRLVGLPAHGPCSLCGNGWDTGLEFFDGLFIGELGYSAIRNEDGTLDTRTTDSIGRESLQLWHSNAFMGTIKVFWLSQFVRYILRPRHWFSETLKDIVMKRLRLLSCDGSSMHCSAPNEISCCSSIPVQKIPRPFTSLHIRYGTKIIEQPSQPLWKYMKFMTTKARQSKHVFVSTETEWVIQTLAVTYPNISFYYLDYDRIQDLKLQEIHSGLDYVHEFILSFANLYVSIEADHFVGSLTSSWCSLIHQLERTRGDGGTDYWSVDIGSQYTSCF